MIKIFKTFGGYVEIDKPEKGCWISSIAPTQKEIDTLTQEYNVPLDVITDVLDVDERPRIEIEDEWTYIILRIPIETPQSDLPFSTIPLGIFITDEFTLTICISKNEVLPTGQPLPFREHYRKISDSINFSLQLFMRSGSIYLRHLKQINQMTTMIEQDLEKSIKNKELNKLLKMEKCLVYFMTSTKGNELVLYKLKNSKKITTELNEDLLEDAMIENQQALELSKIYSDIQSSMMDAFASVISNNLNVVMKKLTLVSIILMIPTLIASLLGMNVPNFMEEAAWAMPAILVLSIVLSLWGVVWFKKREWM